MERYLRSFIIRISLSVIFLIFCLCMLGIAISSNDIILSIIFGLIAICFSFIIYMIFKENKYMKKYHMAFMKNDLAKAREILEEYIENIFLERNKLSTSFLLAQIAFLQDDIPFTKEYIRKVREAKLKPFLNNVTYWNILILLDEGKIDEANLEFDELKKAIVVSGKKIMVPQGELLLRLFALINKTNKEKIEVASKFPIVQRIINKYSENIEKDKNEASE